ncbi:hypothetical protein SLE2022_294340 [Rubroshorea leprosula]
MLKLEVEGWLKRAVEINGEVQALLEKMQTVKWYSRACFGKHVRRKTHEVREIYEKGEFTSDIAIDKLENRTHFLSIPVTSNLKIDLVKKAQFYLKSKIYVATYLTDWSGNDGNKRVWKW